MSYWDRKNKKKSESFKMMESIKMKATQTCLVEANLSYGEQKAKMQACENGTRGFNAAAASDEKLQFNRLVCHANNFPVALKIVEDEMIKRGTLKQEDSYTYGKHTQQAATVAPEAPQQPTEVEIDQNASEVEAPAVEIQAQAAEAEDIDSTKPITVNNMASACTMLATNAKTNNVCFKSLIRIFNDVLEDLPPFYAEKTSNGYKITTDKGSNTYTDKNQFIDTLLNILTNSEKINEFKDKLVEELNSVIDLYDKYQISTLEKSKNTVNNQKGPANAPTEISGKSAEERVVYYCNKLNKLFKDHIRPKVVAATKQGDLGSLKNLIDYFNKKNALGVEASISKDISGNTVFVFRDPDDPDFGGSAIHEIGKDSVGYYCDELYKYFINTKRLLKNKMAIEEIVSYLRDLHIDLMLLPV